MIVELKTERLRTGDIIRTFDGKLGMVINIEDMTPVIIYKCGFDFVSDLIKCTDIHTIGVPDGEQKEKGLEKIIEDIIVKNFLNMRKETLTQVQEVQRIPYMLRYINQTNIN